MNISELLNGSTAHRHREPRPHAERRMDMASLDLFAQKTRQRPELSMSRIIQELADQGVSSSTDQQHVGPQEPTVSTTTRFTETQQEPEPEKLAVKAKRPKAKKTQPKKSTSTGDEVATSPKRRRAKNGFAPLTESEKRVKQRLLVKRSYYRKIDTLVELRNEMEELESKCRDVIVSRQQLRSPRSPASPEEEVEQRCEVLRERYTHLAIAQDDLRHENEKLRAEAMEQSKARTRVGILLNEELRDQKEARTKGKQLGMSPWSSDVPNTNSAESDENPNQQGKSKPVLDFIPLTDDECINIVRDAYADVRAFCDKQYYESSGASVFGWRDRRQIDGETLRFFLEKTFKNYTAAEISSRMWDLVSSERNVNRIYASDVAIEFHLVQRVNEANVLYYRTIKPEGVNMVLKSLVLASRVQINDSGSFLVLFRSIDPVARGIVMKEEPATDFSTDRKEIWSDVFSWGIYEAVGDHGEHCRNSFGGFVSSLLTQRSLEFWLMHVLLIAVRCESEVIGPLFILQ